MRFWSLKTCPSIFRQGRSCHLYIGRCAVFITDALLLTPLPSIHASPRQRIRDITPGIGFLENLFRSLLTAGYLLSSSESAKRITSFRLAVYRAVRVKLSTGFYGSERWSPFETPGPYPVPFWASLLSHVGLFPLTMVPFVRIPIHRHLLAGVARLGSGLTRFSSRFPRLITSRAQGDDAFSCSQRLRNFT